MKENFFNRAKEIGSQEVQEAQRVLKKLDPKKHTLRHIIITLLKIKGKERILKVAREMEGYLTKELPLDHQMISQKKSCRQEGAGKKYSKS